LASAHSNRSTERSAGAEDKRTFALLKTAGENIEIERLRERLAVVDTQMTFQATCLLDRAEEIQSSQRRIANQLDVLGRVQRAAEIEIAARDETEARLNERVAATARALAAATDRLHQLERALERARKTGVAESRALAELRRDDAEFRATLSTMSSELDRWRSRAETADAEAARCKRSLEDAQTAFAAATASRAWRLADWFRRRGGAGRP
jgi:chromosome segregation ATPase